MAKNWKETKKEDKERREGKAEETNVEETNVEEPTVEAEAEAETEKKTEQRKKAHWTFDVVSCVAKVVFPGGKTRHFNLKAVTVGLTISQLAMYYYGFKQWVMSNSASSVTTEDKIASIEADYKGLCEHGLEFAGEGNIGIIGRVRSNANAGVKVQLSKANSLIDLLTKKVEGTITPEEDTILQGMLAAKKEIEAKK